MDSQTPDSTAAAVPLQFQGKTRHAEIIQWDEALVQCGDDEEFLLELLGDLRQELQNQTTVISGIFQVCI
jgi:hypothetical protein